MLLALLSPCGGVVHEEFDGSGEPSRVREPQPLRIVLTRDGVRAVLAVLPSDTWPMVGLSCLRRKAWRVGCLRSRAQNLAPSRSMFPAIVTAQRSASQCCQAPSIGNLWTPQRSGVAKGALAGGPLGERGPAWLRDRCTVSMARSLRRRFSNLSCRRGRQHVQLAMRPLTRWEASLWSRSRHRPPGTAVS